MVTTSYAGQGPGTNKGVQEFKNLIVLSVLAAFLVAGVVVAAVVNPYVLLGLGPVLLAVAAIVRAVGGRSGGTTRGRRVRSRTATTRTR